MPYTDFTLDTAEDRLGLTVGLGDLFGAMIPAQVPSWLPELLDRGRSVAALVSEKARSEFLVAPVLLACRELVPGDLAIYSGQRLDVDQARGLVGECDYILSLTTPVPRLRAPLLLVLEAKRGDIELGLGQCVAQLAGARLFNDRAGSPPRPGVRLRDYGGGVAVPAPGRGGRHPAHAPAVHRQPRRRPGGAEVHAAGGPANCRRE